MTKKTLRTALLNWFHRMTRAMPANQVLIRDTRDQLRWTQERLAEEANLSVRVVAKTESGASVARTTLGKMAAAFTRHGHAYSERDLICDPTQVLADLIQKYRAADETSHSMDGLAVANNVVTLVDGERTWLSVAGEHQGIIAFHETWTSLFSLFDSYPGCTGAEEVLAAPGGAISWGYQVLSGQSGKRSPPCLLIIRIHMKDGLVRRSGLHFDPLGLRVRMTPD